MLIATLSSLEDEAIIAFALEDMLIWRLGRTYAVGSLQDGLANARDERFDFAILDINLHGEKSYPVADWLIEAGVEFIFATGYGDAEHPERFRQVPTVTKPYSVEQIKDMAASSPRTNCAVAGQRHKVVASDGGKHYGPTMRIAIASDHAAIELKAELRDWLIEQGHEVADLGPETADSVDYPDFGYRLASVVADGTAERGVALCGSGIGISMSVNRNPAVRCALVSEPLSASRRASTTMPIASRWARASPAATWPRRVSPPSSTTEFGGGRHQRRVDKLSNPEFDMATLPKDTTREPMDRFWHDRSPRPIPRFTVRSARNSRASRTRSN